MTIFDGGSQYFFFSGEENLRITGRRMFFDKRDHEKAIPLMWKRDLLLIVSVLVGFGFLANEVLPKTDPEIEVLRKSSASAEGRARDASLDESVHGLDTLVRQRWVAAEVEPAADVDELQVIRRLSLTLTGTIPSLEEIRLFEAHPPQGRLEWWIDRTLADRRFPDYLAERLARAYVGVENGPFLVYRRRRFVTWLSDQVASNRPFDELVSELLTSQGLWTDAPATNFFTVATIQGEQRYDVPKITARVSRAFLGVRMDCAQCHDHPFANWSQHDFHQLAAFFGQTRQQFTGVRDGDGSYEVDLEHTGEMVTVEPEVPIRDDLRPEEGSLRAQLAQWITHPENRVFPRATVNRVWALMFGRAYLEPVDDIPVEDEVDPVLDFLANDLVENNFDLQRLIRVIALSKPYRLASRVETYEGEQPIDIEPLAEAWAIFPIVRLRPEQVANSMVQAASLRTRDHTSHILFRFAQQVETSQFVQRYGDAGEYELEPDTQTVSQRLLLLNGELLKKKTEVDGIRANASGRIASLAPDDEKAIEIVFLSVLSRLPSQAELGYFAEHLAGTQDKQRDTVLEDLFATLLNSSEFLCLH